MSVVVKFAVLNAHDIINLCGPERGPKGWDPETIEARKKKTEYRVKVINNRERFFDKLEVSILKHGFRNPILVTAGLFSKAYRAADKTTKVDRYIEMIPPNKRDNLESLLTTERVGGSRLYWAQKHNLEVPCIVNDFVNSIPNGKILKTEEDVLAYFTDKPITFRMDQTGVLIYGLPHIHLSEKL